MIPDKLHVAIAQMGPSEASCDRHEIIDRMVQLLREATARGAQLVAFPELALSPYFPKRMPLGDEVRFFEEEMPNALIAPLLSLARASNVSVTFGYAELDVGHNCFNTAVYFNGLGDALAKYRKIHLPGISDQAPPGATRVYEPMFFKHGVNGYPVISDLGWRVGLGLCQDRRFPETYRNLALGGAEIAIMGYNTPLSSPQSMEQHFLSVRAGCYQNSMYGVFAAKSGKEEGVELIAGSCIIDPHGQIVAMTSGPGDAVVDARISLREVREARERWGFLERRHPAQYAAEGVAQGGA